MYNATITPNMAFLTNIQTDLDEQVILKDKFTLPGFKTMIVHGFTEKTVMMGHKLYVMI